MRRQFVGLAMLGFFALAMVTSVTYTQGVRANGVSPVLSPTDMLVAGEDDEGQGHIWRHSASGEFLGQFESGGPSLDGPGAVRHGPDGKLYVLHSSNTVERYDGLTGEWIDTFISEEFGEAKDMIFSPYGDLLVSANTDDCHGRVMAFSSMTGKYLGDAVPVGSGLAEAMALAIGPRGTLYVGNDGRCFTGNESNAYSVMKFKIPVSGGAYGAPQFLGLAVSDKKHYIQDPNGMTIGPGGDLYIAWEDCRYQTRNGRCAGAITRYDPKTGVVEDIVPGSWAADIGFTEGSGIHFSFDKKTLHVGSGDTGEIFAFNLADPTRYFTFETLFDPKGVIGANIDSQ